MVEAYEKQYSQFPHIESHMVQRSDMQTHMSRNVEIFRLQQADIYGTYPDKNSWWDR